jgi:putative ABC transport system permease protein
MIGIIIGPATIVALLGMTTGFSVGITDQFSKLGASTIFVSPADQDETLGQNDVKLAQSIENIRCVLPYYQIIGTVSRGGETSTVIMTALEIDNLQELIPGLEILDGRLPGANDLTGALIGYNLAFPSDSSTPPFGLNQPLTISISESQDGQVKTTTRTFLVKAITDEFGAAMFINVDNGIFVSLRAGQMVKGSASFDGMYIVAEGTEFVTGIEDKISEVFGDKFQVVTVQSIISAINSILGMVTILLVAITSISVIVAFMGIMTTMFTSVMERTKEVGLLKALGYNNRIVMLIFVSEAAIIGILGGIGGSIIGGIGSYVLGGLFAGGFGQPPDPEAFGNGGNGMGGEGFESLSITPVLTPELILMAIGLAVAVSILAGIIPAWRASRLTPVEALRHE